MSIATALGNLVPNRALLRQAENPYKSQIKALQISAQKTLSGEVRRKETGSRPANGEIVETIDRIAGLGRDYTLKQVQLKV